VRLVKIALAILAVPLGVAAFRLLHDDLYQTEIRSLPAVVIGWTAIATGLVAWWRRPANRMGLLLTLFGFAVLIRTWQYSPQPLVFMVGFALGALAFALFGHVALAYPSGRVTDRFERALVVAGYAAVLAFPLTMLLFTSETTGLKYAPLAPDSPLLVAAHDELARGLERAFVVVFFGVLTACFVALLVRKFVAASARTRRILAPLLLAALVAALRAFYEFLSIFVSPIPAIADYVYWWQVAGQIALSIAIVWGLLSSRLAAAQVADLVRELDRVPPAELEAALARAVGDPTLELAFWLPERGEYVDAGGNPVAVPEPGPHRAVTPLEHDGEPIALIVHDVGLREDPRLLESAGTAIRLALENARLQAELKAQLARVQESRARIVAAGDEQRRRIERDLHDGAQQRLVALALELRVAQKRLGADVPPELEEVLAGAVDELQLAVGELRELARGVHPAILTEDGLAAALESLADRTPLPVTIVSAPERRLPAPIEGAAYFVACEALANAVKHADATAITIRAEQRNGSLVVEVTDNGIGGADIASGSGLRGLADRVEAHGGRLRVESPVGGGTKVTGEVPCGS
jgi:signal transduction histidine kinase